MAQRMLVIHRKTCLLADLPSGLTIVSPPMTAIEVPLVPHKNLQSLAGFHLRFVDFELSQCRVHHISRDRAVRVTPCPVDSPFHVLCAVDVDSSALSALDLLLFHPPHCGARPA